MAGRFCSKLPSQARMVRDVVLAHGLDAGDLEPGLLDQPDRLPDRAHVHVRRDVGLDERPAARARGAAGHLLDQQPAARASAGWCSAAQNAGYSAAPTCSPISTDAIAS